MDLLTGLNEKQLEAALTTEGYVRVIAGAGSGKTKLLVNRYAYLVMDYGIDPSNILCVTFTNKAAGEMKKRIREMIGPEYDTALICTYHGFCARLLRDDAEKLFLTRDFQIIDAAQQKTILGEIYQKHELKLDYASFEMILKQIGIYKSVNYLSYVPRMCSPKKQAIMDDTSSLEREILEEYMQRQKAVGALDFHDLLSFALYLLETSDEVREKWQDKLNYIQVDEFQDSSGREMKLIDILSAKYQNLMIVGDPDQNIYEWRGSDVKLLVDFDKTHDPTQTVFLNRNYRSTPQILKCANHLIDKNKLRLKKDLFTLAPDGDMVVHYHSKSDEAETATIADIIKKSVRSKNYKYSDIAVLYRSGFLSRVVENKLVESGIPYEIYGGVKFYQRMEVLDVIAYLRLIAYNDDLSFKRIVNKPRRKFGRLKMVALEELREKEMTDTTKSLFDVLSEHLDEAPFKNSGAREFVRLICDLRESSAEMSITEIVNRATVDSGYEQYIRELGDEERYENLMEFKRIADEFERSLGENLSLTEFLQQIALQAGEDEGTARDAVKLMTIHAAKGLEFPIVFVIGFSEGIFPSAKTIEERKLLGLEEERRLCYVAITRAEKQLYLMDSEGFSQNGIKKLPSRFLREIGEENYTRIGSISEELDRKSRDYTKRLDEGMGIAEENSLDYSEGDRVEHHAFGSGTIISVDPRRRTFLVRFEKLAQPRNISADYFKTEHKKITIPPKETAPIEMISEKSFESIDLDDTPTLEKTANEAQYDELVYNEDFEEDPNFALDEDEYAPEDEDEPDFDETEAEKDFDEIGTSIESPSFITTSGYGDEAAKNGAGEEFEEEQRFILPEAKQVQSPENDIGRETPPEETDADEEHSIDPAVAEKLKNTENLWNRDDVPHSGWYCTGVSDLGAPVGVCEMCGYQIIRYVHHMVHPHYRPLDVGCICAGKMEGDVEAAKKREQNFKNKEARRENFKKRKWKDSRKGNSYLKIKNHVIVLYKNKNGNGWKYSIDSVFCDGTYPTKEKAINAAFEGLERILYS